MADILFLMLVTFGMSSVFLYSPLFEESRNYIASLTNSSWYILKKLSHLSYCQLCISFWISLVLQQYMLPDVGPIDDIMMAFAVSAVSWSLGAFTTNQLWQKAKAELVVKDWNL